jgi:hypothetical protein
MHRRRFSCGRSAIFFRGDRACGIGVAQALGIDLAEFMPKGAVQFEAVAEK